MRQLCPYCAKLVDLADDAAGREVPCPHCGKAFAVPKTYTPSVDSPVEAAPKPAPPPGLVTPSDAVVTAAMPYDGDAQERGLTLNPKVIAWIPAIALTAALLVSLFFSAVVSFPGGFRVMAQSPLESFFAGVSSTSVATLQDAEKAVKELVKTNWLLLPYFLALIAATALAWFERVFPHPTMQTVPAMLLWIIKFWPRRYPILFLLAAGSFAIIVLQTWRGFGLETAVKDYAFQKYAKQLEAADTTFKKQEVQIQIGQEIGSFCLGGTLPFDLGLLAHAIAVLSIAACWWFDRRGDGAPPPRWVLRY